MARVDEIADLLVMLLREQYSAVLNLEITTTYFPNFDSATFKGRRLYLVPSVYTKSPGEGTRLRDAVQYGYWFVVVERIPDELVTSDEKDKWARELVAWVQSLRELVGDNRTFPLGGDMHVASIAEQEVVNRHQLEVNQTFISETQLTIQEG